jgi:hypothetical protein
MQMAQNYHNKLENEWWEGEYAHDCFGITGA